MTEILIHALKEQNVEFLHLNTQVSRSLSDKGHRQLAKAFLGLNQAVRFMAAVIRYRPGIVYFPLTNSFSFNGFLRDALFILMPSLMGIAVAVHLRGGCCLYLRYRGAKRAAVKIVLSRVTIAIVQGRSLLGSFDGMIPPERIAVVPERNRRMAHPMDK